MIAKDNKKSEFIKYEKKWICCTSCNRNIQVDDRVKSALCSRCTTKLIGCPDTSDMQKIKKPIGWSKLSEFVDSNGNVFYYGKEQPDMKGKLPATNISDIVDDIVTRKIKHKKDKELKKSIKQESLVKEYNKKKLKQPTDIVEEFIIQDIKFKKSSKSQSNNKNIKNKKSFNIKNEFI